MNAAGAVIFVFNPDLVLYAEIWEKGREKRKGLILDMQRKYLYHCLKQLMEHKLVSSRARARNCNFNYVNVANVIGRLLTN